MVDSLLPPNATAEERALETAMSRVEDVPIPVKDLMNPWKCPKELLPFMAWAMSVDYWSPYWSEKVQRQVYAVALKVHQVKGTEGAVIDALATLGFEAVVQIWNEYTGTPGTFKVDVNLIDRGFSEEENSAAMAVILNAKNTRSHLDTLTIHMTNRTSVPVYACALFASEETTIKPYIISEFNHLTSVPVWAATLQSVEEVKIYPKGVV